MARVNQPLYLKIYDYLMEEIRSGKFDSKSRLPSEKELAKQFDVSRITSKKALDMLATEGIIVRIPGKGSFLSQNSSKMSKENQVLEKNKNVSKIIGVIIPDLDDSYGTGLFLGMEEQCAKFNCFMIIRISHGDRDIEEQIIDDFIDVGVDGMIIIPAFGEYYSSKILRLILDEFPLVVVDRQLKGIPSVFVGSNNIQAAYKATKYLFSIGHNNISVLSPPPGNTSTLEDRIKGVKAAYTDNEVVINKDIWVTNIMSTMPRKKDKETVAKDIQSIKSLITKNDEITCIFALEYNIALLAYKALEELGKRIPQDISIICFDHPMRFIREVDFTHIKQKEDEIGRKAVELLMLQMEEDLEERNIQVFVDTDLVIGKSSKKHCH